MEIDFAPFRSLESADLSKSLRWFEQMCDEEMWNISPDEKYRLLGGITKSNYDALLSGCLNVVGMRSTKDILERLGLLMGISTCIEAIAGVESVQFGFVNINSNKLFAGSSLIHFLINSRSIADFHNVKKYFLDQMYG